MDGRETDLEVAGSIGTTTASRRASVREEAAQERANRQYVVDKRVPWKTFKIIFFLICLIFLMIQSVDFLRIYYKYPTAIVTDIIVPKNVKLPAITFCFRNTISIQKFCFYEPKYCYRPRMEEFCTEHTFLCKGDTSNLKIPSPNMEERIMRRYFLNDSYNDASLFKRYNYISKVRTFIQDFDDPSGFLKCYSENLHLYQSGSKPKTNKLAFEQQKGDFIYSCDLIQTNIRPFVLPDIPQVFVAIHSPFVPLNTVEDLHPVRPGVLYEADVQLVKEEHLLPPPYQTDCRDNGPSKDAKESTNPNSYQMCLDLCRSEYAKTMYGCDRGMTMILTVRDLCNRDSKIPHLSSEQKDELRNKRLICFQNCKEGCLKLQYKSTIKEINLRYREPFVKISESRIDFYVKNPEVTVLRHVPLYGSSEIFSNIGGLLGCWLGVSVFTFTNILEKFFRKVVRWKRRFRKRRFTLRRFRKRRFTLRRFRKRNRIEEIQRAPQTSEIHQD